MVPDVPGGREISTKVRFVLPLLPFPPLSWWHIGWREEEVRIDLAEGYQKQTLRNRLMLSDGKGDMMISLPIDHVHRRAHPHVPMRDLRFSGHIPIRQILRSLQTAYGRSPFFEHVMPELMMLVEKHGPGAEGATLGSFAKATLCMMAEWSDTMNDDFADSLWEASETPAQASNALRLSEAELADGSWAWPHYGQPFEDRNGFSAGRSSLDALFCVGPAWTDFLPRPIQS